MPSRPYRRRRRRKRRKRGKGGKEKGEVSDRIRQEKRGIETKKILQSFSPPAHFSFRISLTKLDSKNLYIPLLGEVSLVLDPSFIFCGIFEIWLFGYGGGSVIVKLNK